MSSGRRTPRPQTTSASASSIPFSADLARLPRISIAEASFSGGSAWRTTRPRGSTFGGMGKTL